MPAISQKKYTRWTIAEVEKSLSSENYTLLSKEYINNSTKMKAICPKGHQWQFTWSNFRYGYRCKKCSIERGASRRRSSAEEVLRQIKNLGYTPLTNVYQNNTTKMPLLCPRKHRCLLTWGNLRQGHGCPDCAGNRKKEIEEIRCIIAQEQYVLVSQHYKNSTSKITMCCPKKHIFETTWGHFQRGHRCPYCANKIITLTDIRQTLRSVGYILKSGTYSNCYTRLLVQCPKGHQYQVTWTNFQQGYRCPYCLYKSEHKLGQILEKLFPNKIKKQGNLGFLGRQRVDYYLEEEKIAIEYDGQQHYHPLPGAFGAKTQKEAEQRLKEIQKRDKRKEQLCKENGWRLIRIKYDEPLDLMYVKEKVYL